MQRNLSDSWKNILQVEFEKPYFQDLQIFVKESYKNTVCYPREQDIFAAFNACSFNSLNVVIIGQDPYHGKGQANGLCFSVQEGIQHPPSLINIFKELQADVGNQYAVSGNLLHWAEQGILLLNATLTVAEGKAGSHQKRGWEQFTDAVIAMISERKSNVIFLLWGGFAKQKGKNIDASKHHILTSGHPSPLSANRGYWFGNKHFSKTNEMLEAQGKSRIKW